MGAIQTTKNGQVERGNKPPSLAKMLEGMGKELARALPKHVSAERMMRIATTALRVNPDLPNCSQASFLGSVLSAAQLGLEVNTPLQQAYLIPRKDKDRGLECTLLIGYQGFMDLARRSGEVAAIYAEAVYPGDSFSYELGLEKKLTHKPSEDPDREERPLTHVYGVAKLKSGEALFVVLTRAQVEKYRKRGGNRRFSPWDTDYEAMAKKTAIRRLFTWIPKSAEVAHAVALDEASEVGRVQTVDFDPNVTAALEAHGIEVAHHDPDTGEVPGEPVREPGDDSDIE